MDGINGITVLYALVSIGSFAWLFRNDESFELLVVMGIGCLVFGFFNVRKKAKTFAGDVGSVSMAIFLAYFMIKLIFETGQIGYILFFSIYGVDAIITILYRLKNKENIFQAHRSHLYQYLANELKWPHVVVSLLYGTIQLVLNGLVIWLVGNNMMSFGVLLILLVLIAIVYFMVRKTVKAKIGILHT
jgi:UDP-N-acetylmuramyl pentapeptide phosphotransferase/UDP-N-acetylglucosamine-1-phosphate transferase